jgi:hypothetical protein
LGIFKGVSNKSTETPTSTPPPPTTITPEDTSKSVAVPTVEIKPVEKTTKTTATYYPKISRQDSLIARKESIVTTSSRDEQQQQEQQQPQQQQQPVPPPRKDTLTPSSALGLAVKSGYESESGDEFGPGEWKSPQSVALKPYSHQVGGHSALFKFSRHAVCKPLIEKENAFYQEIEINRPECKRATHFFSYIFLLMVVLSFIPRYIGTLNVTHRDVTTTEESAPPSPTSKSPKSGSPMLAPSSTHAPTRAITPLPEVQIDKNRHVSPHF